MATDKPQDKIKTLRKLCRVYGWERVAAVMGVTRSTVERKTQGERPLLARDIYRLMLVWYDVIDWGPFIRQQLERVEGRRIEDGKCSLIDHHPRRVNGKRLGKYLGVGRRGPGGKVIDPEVP